MPHHGDGFYVVWNPAHGKPTVRHARYDDAKHEAERLARMNPGEDFYILGSLLLVHNRDVDVTRVVPADADPTDLPF